MAAREVSGRCSCVESFLCFFFLYSAFDAVYPRRHCITILSTLLQYTDTPHAFESCEAFTFAPLFPPTRRILYVYLSDILLASMDSCFDV